RRTYRPVGLGEQPLEFAGADVSVEVDAQPAAVPHVRWPEVGAGVRSDERLLRARRRGAPHVRPPHVVMTLVVGGELLLPTHEPGRMAVAEALLDLGERQADSAYERL